MESLKSWLAALLFLVFGLVIGLQLSGTPFMAALTGAENRPRTQAHSREAVPPENPENNDEQEAVRSAADDGPGPLTADYLERVLTNVDGGQRQQILADEDLFQRFVEQEALNRSLKAAAHANGMHENENVRFLMARAGDNVLREVYLNRLMQEQLPDDFPDEAQVQQFYEQNPDQFRISERVQVWQVFLPVPADAGPDQEAAVEKQAKELLDRIRAGKETFAHAATEFSAHEPSRQNDGFMGAVQTSDLKPAIAGALDELKEGELQVVRSEEGWHLLKKGRTLAAERLPYEKVRQQARRLLIEQARRQFRQAVHDEAEKTYPFLPADNRIEQWRLELKNALHKSVPAAE